MSKIQKTNNTERGYEQQKEKLRFMSEGKTKGNRKGRIPQVPDNGVPKLGS